MRLIREMTDKDKVQGIHDYLKGTKVNEAGLKNLAPYFIGELRELTDFSHYVTRCIETLEGAFTFQYTQCFFVGASASSAHLDVVLRFLLACRRWPSHARGSPGLPGRLESATLPSELPALFAAAWAPKGVAGHEWAEDDNYEYITISSLIETRLNRLKGDDDDTDEDL
jgi:hypothetical protein